MSTPVQVGAYAEGIEQGRNTERLRCAKIAEEAGKKYGEQAIGHAIAQQILAAENVPQ